MSDIRHECASDIRFMKRMRFWREVLGDLGLALGVVALAYLTTGWA